MKKLILCSLAVLMVPTFAWGGSCSSTPKVGSYADSIKIGDSGQGFMCGVLGARGCNYGQVVLVNGQHSIPAYWYNGKEKQGAINNTNLEYFVCKDADGDVDYWVWSKHSPIRDCKDGDEGYHTIGTDSAGNILRAAWSASLGSARYFAGDHTKVCKQPKGSSAECPNGKTKATKNITITGKCGGTCTIVMGECYETEKLKCLEAIERKEPADWNGQKCICGDKMVWDSVNFKCVGKTGPNPGQSCQQRRQTRAGKQCCLHKTATWEPVDRTKPDDEGECRCPGYPGVVFNVDKATCDPVEGCDKYKSNPAALDCCNASASGASWNETTNTCDCVEGKKWNAAQKQCVKDNSNVLSDCTYRFSGKVKCANGNSLTINQQRPLTVAELGDMSCDQFNNLYQSDVSKLNEFFTNACNGGAFISIVTGPSAAEVESAKSTLSAFFSAAQSNASVWKDSEGKFNKARLASDLTAGVVLGSVGGVVSGVVIKKNQVKKGFEALHCAVGGQKVADWGDEFNVGLR